MSRDATLPLPGCLALGHRSTTSVTLIRPSPYLIERFAERFNRQRQIGFFLGAGVWASFHLWDMQLFTGRPAFETLRLVRLGIGLPLILLCGLLAMVPRLRKDWTMSLLGSTAILVAWTCLVYMLAINDPATTFDLYVPGLMTILLYHFMMFRHRWLIASVVGVLLVVVFNLAGHFVLQDVMSRQLSVGWFSANAYMVTIVMVGAVLCYQIEASFYLTETQRLALQDSNETIAASHRESESAMLQARRAHQERTDFLLKTSHDLRQPMNAIRYYVKCLRDTVRRSDEQELVDKLQRAVMSMDDLYLALHDFNRLDANSLDVNQSPVFLPLLIEEEVGNCMPMAVGKELQLRVRLACSPWVETDPQLVRRILRNLLTNALAYTQRGGVLIAVRSRGAEVLVQVFDTGPGISADECERIFQPFVRLRAQVSQTERGLGLGLAIAAGMAQRLGSCIHVASRPGRGSTFGFHLRRIDPPVAMPSRIAQPLGSVASSAALVKCIAVVEDDPDILDATQTLLMNSGYQVVASRNLAGLLSGLAGVGAQPDLLLADVELADGEDGWAVHDQVNRRSQVEVPMILITGSVAARHRDRAARGGHQLLQKPCEPETLLAAVQHAIRPAGGG